jgi:hypothetical protein
MTAIKNAQAAALEALIEAHATELKLPTVKRRFRALAALRPRPHRAPHHGRVPADIVHGAQNQPRTMTTCRHIPGLLPGGVK